MTFIERGREISNREVSSIVVHSDSNQYDDKCYTGIDHILSNMISGPGPAYFSGDNISKKLLVICGITIILFSVAMAGCVDDNGNGISSTHTYTATDQWTDNTTGNLTYWLELNHTKVIEIDWRWYNLIEIGDLVTLDENDNIIDMFPWKY